MRPSDAPSIVVGVGAVGDVERGVSHLGRADAVDEARPRYPYDALAGHGLVAADGDEAADVRLVRAVPGVEPDRHRVQVALAEVEAGQLGPGDRESENPGGAPAFDRLEHVLAALRGPE